MISTQNPLIAQFTAGQARDHIVSGRQFPIELQLQMDHCGTGAQMIRERQRSAKWGRRNWSAERLEQRGRVGIRDWQDRNFGDGLGFFARQSLRIFGCADARGQRVAWIYRRIQDATTLRAVCRPPAALRV